MKTDRLKWRWRSSLEAERSGAGPDQRICVSLSLSGQNPKMTHVHRDVLGFKIIGRETPACHITVATETWAQTWLESRRSRAADGSLDPAPWDPSGFSKRRHDRPEECRGMRRASAVTENIFKTSLWHHVSNCRSSGSLASLFPPKLSMSSTCLTLAQSFSQAAAFTSAGSRHEYGWMDGTEQ